MRKIFALLAAALFLAGTAGASPQSLADLAKKEKERRENITSQVKVITNRDSQKYRDGAVTTATIPQPAPAAKPGSTEESAALGGAAETSHAADEPTDLAGRTESFWRQTMKDAHQKVKDLTNEANVLQLKLADLQNRFYTEDNGFKQQEIGREIQKAFYEQDLNKEELAKAQEMLQELLKEARKSGALPGWLTVKQP